MISVPQRLNSQPSQWKEALWQFGSALRVALPGIIKSFDPEKQTVVVQPAISEVVYPGINPAPVNQPIEPLFDVPIMLPRGGGFTLTVPVNPGDECLVVFADLCIDAWWKSGGQQNQVDRRRHDLSDGFAILGCWSQPRVLPSYSTASTQLRSDDGTVAVDVSPTAITLKAPAVSAEASGGTATPVLTQAFLTWFTANVIPFLTSKGYAGPPPPAASTTTVFEAE